MLRREGIWLDIVRTVFATAQTAFLDSNGKHLFTLKKNTFTLRGSHAAYTPDDKVLFEVKGKFGCESRGLDAPIAAEEG